MRAVIREEPAAAVGIVLLIGLVVVAVGAPWIAPSDPGAIDVSSRLTPPAWTSAGSLDHVLGTDALGRDVLSRIIYGARVSLLVGASVVGISALVGTVLGIVAGLNGGWVDAVVMRVAEAQLAFPGLLLIIAVISLVGPSVTVIIAVLSLYGWMIYARVVRGHVLRLAQEPFVRAARMTGCGTGRMIRRHILPSLATPLLTQAMLEFARVVLAESSLSYLGLGIQPPAVSWGLMVAENQAYLDRGWWTVVFPGAALALTVLVLNLLANWWRTRSDPEQRALVFAQKVTRSRARA